MSDENILSGIDRFYELLSQALPNGFAVSVSIHDVPGTMALDWLTAGLLDEIVPGAKSNPPTGKRSIEREGKRPVEVTVFTSRKA